MSRDKRPPGIATAIRNLDYEREIDRLKRSGGAGTGGSSSPAVSIAAVRSNAGGTQITSVAGWNAVPIPTNLTSEPATGAFTFGTNWVAPVEPGWYDVSASVIAVLAGASTVYASLSTSAVAGDGDVANDGATGGYARANASGTVKLAAAQRVYLYGYSSGAGIPLGCQSFSIAKVGGAKGDKGDLGGTMEASYAKYTTTVNIPNGGAVTNITGWARQDYIDNTAYSIVGSNVVVRDSGLYDIKAQVGSVAGATRCFGRLAGPSGELANFNGMSPATTTGEGSVISVTVQLAAGQGVFLQAFQDGAAGNIPFTLTIARVGGPKGDKGDPGGTMGALSGSWQFTGGTVPTNVYTKSTLVADPYHPADSAFVISGGTDVVIPESGYYHVAAFTVLNPATPPTQLYLQVYVDRPGNPFLVGIGGYAAAAGSERISVSRPVWLAAGDKISAQAYSLAANTIQLGTTNPIGTGGQYSGLSIARVGGPKGDPGPPNIIPLVNVLPSSPVDGQEVYYQNAAMAALGVMWHLRYRSAASGAYKWEFVGGSPWLEQEGAGVVYTTGAAAYAVGPALTVPKLTTPLPGEYLFSLSLSLLSGGTYGDVRTYLFIAGAQRGNGAVMGAGVGYLYGANFTHTFKIAVAAGVVADLRAASSTASASLSIYDRFLSMVPVRVG